MSALHPQSLSSVPRAGLSYPPVSSEIWIRTKGNVFVPMNVTELAAGAVVNFPFQFHCEKYTITVVYVTGIRLVLWFLWFCSLSSLHSPLFLTFDKTCTVYSFVNAALHSNGQKSKIIKRNKNIINTGIRLHWNI